MAGLRAGAKRRACSNKMGARHPNGAGRRLGLAVVARPSPALGGHQAAHAWAGPGDRHGASPAPTSQHPENRRSTCQALRPGTGADPRLFIMATA